MNNLLITMLPKVRNDGLTEGRAELTKQNNSYSNQQHECMMVPEERDDPYEECVSQVPACGR